MNLYTMPVYRRRVGVRRKNQPHRKPRKVVPRLRLKGRGDYLSAMAGGGGLGAALGGPGGALLGAGAGALYHLITGKGDYKVKSNTLMNMGTPVPSFDNGVRRNIICHREYIQDINSAVNFTNISFPINPGLSGSFPWLSAIAANYEQYRILGMVYQFKSTSANALNSTNTALGTMIACTEYNTVAPGFTNKQEMENHQYAVSCKPSEDLLHPIECAVSDTFSPIKFIRNGGVPQGTDSRLYDHGNFQLAAVGSQAVAVVGELWVSYEIEFLKPILKESSEDVFHCQLAIAGIGTSTAFFGTQTDLKGEVGSNISVSLGTTYDSQLVFNDDMAPGNYLMTVVWRGAQTNVGPMNIQHQGDRMNTYPGFFSDASSVASIATPLGSTTDSQVLLVTFGVLPPDGTTNSIWMAFGGAGSVPGTLTGADMYITPLFQIST